MAKFKADYIEERSDYFRRSRGWGFEPHQSFEYYYNCVVGGRGLPLNGDVWVIIGSYLGSGMIRFFWERGKAIYLRACVRVCGCVCVCAGMHARHV